MQAKYLNELSFESFKLRLSPVKKLILVALVMVVLSLTLFFEILALDILSFTNAALVIYIISGMFLVVCFYNNNILVQTTLMPIFFAAKDIYTNSDHSLWSRVLTFFSLVLLYIIIINIIRINFYREIRGNWVIVICLFELIVIYGIMQLKYLNII